MWLFLKNHGLVSLKYTNSVALPGRRSFHAPAYLPVCFLSYQIAICCTSNYSCLSCGIDVVPATTSPPLLVETAVSEQRRVDANLV